MHLYSRETDPASNNPLKEGIVRNTPGSIAIWGTASYGLEELPEGDDYIAVASGDFHALALRTDGTIVAWGAGTTNTGIFPHFGQSIAPAGNNFVAIAAGSMHSLALRDDGTLISWGRNNHGQTDVPPGNNFIAIACGGLHSLAIQENGSIVAWGAGTTNTGVYPNFGQSIAPEGNDFEQLAAGAAHSLALKSDGSLIAWGRNNYGQSSVPTGENYASISAQNYHNLALRTNGSIASWGRNSAGQCDVPVGNDFIDVSAGREHSIGLKSDGSLLAWGMNTHGQCEVPEGSHYTTITAGYQHSIALKSLQYGLISPVGGEHWQIGTERLIRWHFKGPLVQLQLQFSSDNGVNWQDIASVEIDNCSYNWTVPSLPSSSCMIRGIFVYEGTEHIMEHDTPFTITEENVPLLTLLHPATGNIRLQAGSVEEITWNSSGIDHVDLYYSIDNGLSWTEIAGQIPAENGSYLWSLPETPTEQGRIRVQDSSNPLIDHTSHHPFTIVKIGFITTMSGLELTGGSYFTIEFLAVFSDRFRLSYSGNNGEEWIYIENDWNQSNYNWLIPNLESYEVVFRIEDYQDEFIYAITEPFSISKDINLIAPDGGENLLVGTTYLIEWDSSDSVNNVLIDYSIDNGNTWLPIQDLPYPASTESFEWVVPDTQSAECLVRVKNVANYNSYGCSSSVFTISDRSLIVIQPSGGEVWFPGSEEIILWEGINVSEVSLSFSYDGGNNWLLIEEGIPANSPPYLWEIPEVGTMSGKIRVSDMENPMINAVSDGLFVINHLNPPQNLIGVLVENMVELDWESPLGITGQGELSIARREEQLSLLSRPYRTESRWQLEGYNVYRDGDIIGQVPADVTCFVDDEVALWETYSYYITAVYDQGESLPSNSVEIMITSATDDNVIPLVTKLHNNYPNPFNPTTTIAFTLSEPGRTILEIFNNRGQRISTIINAHLPVGEHHIVWNGRDRSNHQVSSGIYFYRLRTTDYTATKKMMILK